MTVRRFRRPGVALFATIAGMLVVSACAAVPRDAAAVVDGTEIPRGPMLEFAALRSVDGQPVSSGAVPTNGVSGDLLRQVLAQAVALQVIRSEYTAMGFTMPKDISAKATSQVNGATFDPRLSGDAKKLYINLIETQLWAQQLGTPPADAANRLLTRHPELKEENCFDSVVRARSQRAKTEKELAKTDLTKLSGANANQCTLAVYLAAEPANVRNALSTTRVGAIAGPIVIDSTPTPQDAWVRPLGGRTVPDVEMKTKIESLIAQPMVLAGVVGGIPGVVTLAPDLGSGFVGADSPSVAPPGAPDPYAVTTTTAAPTGF